MKKLIGLLILICLSKTIYSQNKSAYNWYFGNKAAITFNTQPPTALSGSELFELKNSSCISDYDGNLLFYTNGLTIWDKDNNIMPNGNGLLGNHPIPLGQRVIIIPHPSNINLYYVFCISLSGLYYSVVDMNLNGGNGNVVSGQKNIFVENDARNYMTAVGDENGYWLLVQRGGANEGSRAYRIDNAGFNSNAIVNNVSSYRHCKFTPSGGRVAVDNGEWGIIVYDFDMETGILDNPITFLPDGIQINSFAFSPNERFLYVNHQASKIVQYDLLAGSPTDIANSAFIVYENSVHDLQLGIDGKIYVSIYGSTHLAAINEPNQQGAACDFELQAVHLGGSTAQYGLPTFVQSFFLPQEIEILASNACLYENSSFQISNTENIQSVLWNFGDSQTSTELNPTHIYASAGTYTVTLDVTFTDNSTQTVTKDIEIFDKPLKPTIEHE